MPSVARIPARLRRVLIALLTACALVAVAPAAAQAHATLEQTTPAGGTHLDAGPRAIVLRFSEPVSAALGAVKVFAADGTEVRVGAPTHPGGDGEKLAVAFTAPADGGYTVTYRIISSDSHPVSGGFVFTVGDPSAQTAAVGELLRSQGAAAGTATALSVARGVQYLAIALALGSVLFVLTCWLPALSTFAGATEEWAAASRAFAERTRTLLTVAGWLGLGSALVALVLEATEAQGGSPFDALASGVVDDLLATRFGATWALAGLIWCGLGILVALGGRVLVPSLRTATVGAAGLALPRGERKLAILGGGLVVLALMPALSGHASVQTPVWVLLPMNVMHVAAMSAWLGGIAILVLGLRTATMHLAPADRTVLLGDVLARFSALAGVAFTLLVLSGSVQAVVEVGSVGALTGTAYGRYVLIKIGLVGAVLAAGWVQRSKILPGLRAAAATESGPGSVGVLLRRLLNVELAVGVAAIAVTGLLAGAAPSVTQRTGASGAGGNVAGAPGSGPTVRAVAAGPLALRVTAPASSGPLLLQAARGGRPFAGAEEVRVTAALPARRIAPVALKVVPAGRGRWRLAGRPPVSGEWTLTVTVRVSAFDEYAGRVTLPFT